jgi:dUTP pyrophosphatase
LFFCTPTGDDVCSGAHFLIRLKKKVIVLSQPFARIPTRGSEGAAGFDLYACEDLKIPARSNNTIIAMMFPIFLVFDPIMAIFSFVVAHIYLLYYTSPPTAIVNTGVCITGMPQNVYARVAPRSGLAAKHHLHVGAGVVDSDYRGEIKVVLFNLGTAPFHIERNQRIAQLIFERIEHPITFCEKSTIDETQRGTDGFGSTG